MARVGKGEAIAAGRPDDKRPVVKIDRNEYTPSTFNTPDFTEKMAVLLKARFGEQRVVQMQPVMGGEDFGRFARDDQSIKSLIFWVGVVPAAEIAAATTAGRNLPRSENGRGGNGGGGTG